MPASTYFAGLILDHALLQQPYSIENWYVGFWLTEPAANGVAGEVTANDYLRKAVVWTTAWANTSQMDWPPATSTWGNINYVVLVDSSTKATGNLLAWGTTSKFVDIGRPLTIPVGGLTLSVT